MIENYRPISLICNFAKIFETILHKFISFNIRSLITVSQHGFVNGRSTTSNLCEFTQFVADNLDAKRQVDVAYTDFSKAFDKLDHGLLHVKLRNFGFSSALFDLISSYLSNRVQVVNYNGYESSKTVVSSGVPQGSILGPLFFVIYINDVVRDIKSNVLMYADDLKIFREVNSFEDCLSLQNDLHTFHNWSNSNLLPVNYAKCYIMSFTNKTSLISYGYTLNN
ncbi:reverse transcriptase family protein, partial [Enterobacter cloacae complex sp. 2DZ2F20B]|uniref:RNA-directed DNA polymerase n=1 Tax=Enterobacter cloacae complex sp. 2DZ2F20B TaxID=2511993 RepID=UPI001024B221